MADINFTLGLQGLDEFVSNMDRFIHDDMAHLVWEDSFKEAEEFGLGLLRQTVSPFTHQPTFSVQMNHNRDRWLSVQMVFQVSDDEAGQRWLMLEEGVGPHTIPVGQKGFLAFREGYQAKTIPLSLQSVSGGPYGDWVYTRKAVEHPGIVGRRWLDVIQPQLERYFTAQVLMRLESAILWRFR